MTKMTQFLIKIGVKQVKHNKEAVKMNLNQKNCKIIIKLRIHLKLLANLMKTLIKQKSKYSKF